MPKKEEEQRRKVIRLQLEASQRTKELAEMPLSISDLKDLFDYLNVVIWEKGCDHTCRLTRKFCDGRKLNTEKVIQWCGEFSGFCDCEVLGNVEEHWGKTVGRI